MTPNQLAELGDEELVALAQKGERKAFEELVERYKKKAYYIAFDFTRDREEAKDLSQEAFLRAFAHLGSFDMRATFYSWFYRILVNLCVDYLRRRRGISWENLDEKTRREAEKKAQAMPPLPDRRVMAEEISRRVGAALNALPKKQRTAFLLRNHQGLSIQEIAKIMKAAEGTVKVHLHRAVTALRVSLADLA